MKPLDPTDAIMQVSSHRDYTQAKLSPGDQSHFEGLSGSPESHLSVAREPGSDPQRPEVTVLCNGM